MSPKCQVVEAESKYFTPVNSGDDKINEIKYCTLRNNSRKYDDYETDGKLSRVSRERNPPGNKPDH